MENDCKAQDLLDEIRVLENFRSYVNDKQNPRKRITTPNLETVAALNSKGLNCWCPKFSVKGYINNCKAPDVSIAVGPTDNEAKLNAEQILKIIKWRLAITVK